MAGTRPAMTMSWMSQGEADDRRIAIGDWPTCRPNPQIVMAGLVPAIHVFFGFSFL
jgi:hypothetical protein